MVNKIHKIFCSRSVDCILSGQKTCIQHVKDINPLCHFPENSNLLIKFIIIRISCKVLVCMIIESSLNSKITRYKNNEVMMCYFLKCILIFVSYILLKLNMGDIIAISFLCLMTHKMVIR